MRMVVSLADVHSVREKESVPCEKLKKYDAANNLLGRPCCNTVYAVEIIQRYAG